MTDRVADIHGLRTPHARGTVWPARVDQYLDEGVEEADVDRWVQSACLLCSNGCGCDIAVKDGQTVGIRGRSTDRVNHGRLGPKGLYGSTPWASSHDDPLTPFMEPGDILGHEPMGVVEDVGSEVGDLVVGDRVVLPFQISCGSCWMCGQGLYTQCETTQVREQGMGAALFGYTKLYGQVPGAQAEFLRVPHADFMPIKVPEGPPDDRFLYLSDVIPTAWQAVEYADVPTDGTLLVLGLGPIGEMACRIARHRGVRVIGVDRVPGRLGRTAALGVDVIDLSAVDGATGVGDAVRDRTQGRGADAVVDAVGMEAHGSPVAEMGQRLFGALPRRWSAPVMSKVGLDRMAALLTAIDAVRRGGTISISGVYGGMSDPLPMLTLFDKQLQLRMGQANVKRWVDAILPLVLDDADPLETEFFATDHLPLSDAPQAYAAFQSKQGGAIKTVFHP